MSNWKSYTNEFSSACIEAGRDSGFIASCLAYAKKLHSSNLPIIFDLKHFSMLIGYEQGLIQAICNASSRFYSEFSIPKKSGGMRCINCPYPSLMEIQRWILDTILVRLPISRYAKAYVKAGNLKSNGKFHRSQKTVMRLDIKDFFPSIRFSHIYGIFKKCGYSKKLSLCLSFLTTLEGTLPQGAPTSPCLSNIIFKRIDGRIGAYALSKKIRYTRYADDLYFSGDIEKPGKIISFVRDVILPSGFHLNENKTRIMRQNNAQLVTGIVTNKKLNAPRYLRRDLRKVAYYIEKYGIESHLNHCSINIPNYLPKLLGQASFVKFINSKAPEIDNILKVFQETKSKLSVQK